MEQPSIFVRKSSGLVRSWTSYDAMIYGLLGNMQYAPIMYALYAQMLGNFPGTDAYTGLVLASVGSGFMLAVYAMLSASMPRSGGDYVWISRTINPAIGFATVTTAATIFYMCWMAWVGWNLAVIGVSSTFALLGKLTANDGLTAIATWSQGPEGVFLWEVFSIVLPAIMISFGMRKYALIQRGIFGLTCLVTVIFWGILAISTRANFISGFNQFFNMTPNLYDRVISTASVSTTFSWSDTLTWTAYIAPGMMFCWYSAPMLGEIKNANSLKSMMAAMVLPSFLSGGMLLIETALLYSTIGHTFLASLGKLIAVGDPLVTQMPFTPYFIYMPLLIVPSIPLIILGFITFVAYTGYINAGNILGPSRYLFAQSFDRVLPSKLAYVHPRFSTPLVALGVMIGGGVIWLIWSSTYPQVWLFASAATLAALVANAIVCITGIVFPYRKSSIYEASPCVKYKIARVPLLTILGVIGLIWTVSMMYFFLSIPALGVAGLPPASYYAIVGVFVGSIVVYYISRWYRKRQGINLDLAFKELAPL